MSTESTIIHYRMPLFDRFGQQVDVETGVGTVIGGSGDNVVVDRLDGTRVLIAEEDITRRSGALYVIECDHEVNGDGTPYRVGPLPRDRAEEALSRTTCEGNHRMRQVPA